MKLYDLRIELGLTAEELGQAAGVSADTIRNLESGRARPHTRTAHRLTRYLTEHLGRPILASELFPAEEAAA